MYRSLGPILRLLALVAAFALVKLLVDPATVNVTIHGTTGDTGNGNGGQTLNCAPAANATMTNTVSHLCGFADTTNTGVPAGTTLYPASDGPGANTGSGWSWDGYTISTTSDNAIIKNVECSPCAVSINHPGATLEDSNIASTQDSYGIEVRGVDNATIDHNTIHGTIQGSGSNSGWCGVGIEMTWIAGKDNPDHYTVTNNNIYWCSNPTNNFINGGLVENNYAHDFANSNLGAHYEAMQLQSYVKNSTLLTIQDNTFLNQHTDQTAAIILSNDCNQPCTPLPHTYRTITHNLLAGGGYTFYARASVGAPVSTDLVFTDNHISPVFADGGGGWGADTYWSDGSGDVWSGNVWDDTGTTWSHN